MLQSCSLPRWRSIGSPVLYQSCIFTGVFITDHFLLAFVLRDWVYTEVCLSVLVILFYHFILTGFGHILVVVDCMALTAPDNGRVDTSSGTTFNKEATYSCNTGYRLDGEMTRTCLSNGQWSSSEPSCVRKSVNMVRVCTMITGTVKMIALHLAWFECQYYFSHPVICPNLSISNGRVSYSSNTPRVTGAIATFTCNEGYMLSGIGDRTCGATEWLGTSPTCDR